VLVTAVEETSRMLVDPLIAANGTCGVDAERSTPWAKASAATAMQRLISQSLVMDYSL